MAKKDAGINDPEDYITDEANTSTGKVSSSASRNAEKIGQDEPYSVISEDTEAPGANSTDEADQFAGLMDEEEIEDDGTEPKTAAERNDGLTSDDSEDDVEIVMGTEADVTEEDLVLLGDKDQDMDGGDDEDGNRVGLDATDEDGDPLNESSGDFAGTGDDLDIPDADMDDPAGEALGQGDEENNYYSLGSDDNDNMNEGTP